MALVLQQLIEVCPDEYVNMRHKYGWYPLHMLASSKDHNNVRAGMIRSLCEARADVEVVKGRANQTPLMAAVNTGHMAAARELTRWGADPYKRNAEGTTILDMAWHNAEMGDWARSVGQGKGHGVSGKGRLLRYIMGPFLRITVSFWKMH